MTAFLVVGVTGLLALVGLVLDGGLALSAKVEAIGIAQEAARAGAQQLDLNAYRADGSLTLDPAAASSAAHAYLDAAGAAGSVNVVGNTVTVIVTATQPTQILQLVGITTLTVDGSGSAQPRRGITSPEP
ncbi:pilus assembly protein TadG-related protein [Jiangella muralis]|uniref:pilus assembly protein TadG-related protein n=1 Tax=Jiangella muralis TaxID=702383 RepID=UPI00069D3484|nr:pilus assembly protein TadG-related protein [Jiangella muralis]